MAGLSIQRVVEIIGDEVPDNIFKAGTFTGDGSAGNPYAISLDMLVETLSQLPGYQADGSVFLASDWTWKTVASAPVGDVLLTDLNFSVNTGLSVTATNWTGVNGQLGNYLNYGLANKKLASGNNGYIRLKFVDALACDAILAFNSSNVSQPYQGAAYEAAFWISSENNTYDLSVFDNGVYGNTGIAAVMNNYYRINRVGSQLKLQRSTDGTTYTDIYTYGFTSSADLFINANIDVAKKMYSPKGYNLS